MLYTKYDKDSWLWFISKLTDLQFNSLFAKHSLYIDVIEAYYGSVDNPPIGLGQLETFVPQTISRTKGRAASRQVG